MLPSPRSIVLAALASLCPHAAQAQEVFAGAYAHAVETPLTFATGEGGADLQIGYRFARWDALRLLGRPAPYVLASVNTRGDTSFAGAGLSWKIAAGPVYARPELGVVVHDGPSLRIGPRGRHTELGSRVLFEPGLSVGTQLTDRLGIEASWIHISQGRLLNARQNPGVDMWGARLNWKL